MFGSILRGRWFFLAVAAIVVFSGSVIGLAADQPTNHAQGVSRIAVVTPKAASDEFAAALKKMGWKADGYEDTTQDWNRLGKKLGDYDIVLAYPGMNNASSADLPKALLGFMQAGGAVVETGVDAPKSVGWLASLDPKYEVQVKAKKAPDAVVNPYRSNTILSYPERPAAAGVAASYFDFAGRNSREWEIAGRRRDNKPCVIVKRFGKGALILSTAQFRDAAFIGNVAKLLELQRMGVAYVRISHQYGDEKAISLGHGMTRLTLENTSGTSVAVRAVMSVAGKEVSRTFWGNGSTDKNRAFRIDIPVMMDVRGPIKAKIILKNSKTGAQAVLFSLSAEIPKFLEIDPPIYRGMISTVRRDPDVHFAVQLNPIAENIEGMKVRVSVAGPDGKVITSKEIVATGGARDGRIPVSLPLPADASVGTYTLAVKAVRDGVLPVSATASFKIVPVRPGQMFVDQDGVLLEEGKPFFPIGLYHVAGSEIEAAAKTGVNMMQFWHWDAKPANFTKLKQAGIHIIYESDAWGQVVRKGGKFPEHYDFEVNPDFCAKAEQARDSSSHVLGMWYTADEPSYSMLTGVQHINDYWHTLDENHPTFIVSTGDPRLASGADVLGVDVYPIYRGSHRQLTIVGDHMDIARRGVRYRKPVIAVLEAFGDNARHHEKPEEMRAMSYIAVAHGVQGIFWYCWKETGDKTGEEGVGNHPKGIKALTKVIAEIKVFSPSLLVPGSRRMKSADGRIHAILCGNKATGRFLIYVNTEYEPCDSTLFVPELDGATLEPLYGGPGGAVSDGKLTLKLPPLATGAFRVKAK